MKKHIPIQTILFLFLFIALNVNAKNYPSYQLTVIVEESEILPDNDFYSPGKQMLSVTLNKLLESYLLLKGHTFEIRTKRNSDSIIDYLSKTGSIKEGNILFLKPSFEFEDRVMTISNRSRQSRTIVPNYLNVKLVYQYYVHRHDKNELIEEGETVVKARRDWLKAKNNINGRQLRLKIQGKPEPAELVIMRVLEQSLFFLGNGTAQTNRYDNILPVKLFIDSSYIKENIQNWNEGLDKLISLTSQSFIKQFNTTLITSPVINITTTKRTDKTEDIYQSIKRVNRYSEDTLSLGIYKSSNHADYYIDNYYEKMGLSELGQRLVVINDFPKPHPDFNFWKPKFNSLTLLHEIGHAFGAVHVSDINSVMNQNLTINFTDRYDSFNYRIIKDALNKEILFDKPLEYISYISKQLRNSDYNLVDIPQLFYSFINQTHNPNRIAAIKKAIAYDSFIKAVDGYMYLMIGKYHKATILLKEAIKEEPNQASFYYYLSKAATGNEAKEALEKAAKFGYYQAQVELSKK